MNEAGTVRPARVILEEVSKQRCELFARGPE